MRRLHTTLRDGINNMLNYRISVLKGLFIPISFKLLSNFSPSLYCHISQKKRPHLVSTSAHTPYFLLILTHIPNYCTKTSLSMVMGDLLNCHIQQPLINVHLVYVSIVFGITSHTSLILNPPPIILLGSLSSLTAASQLSSPNACVEVIKAIHTYSSSSGHAQFFRKGQGYPSLLL